MTNLASPWKRVLAYAIDKLVFAILVIWVVSRVTGSGDITGIMDNLVRLILVMIFGMAVYGLLNIILTSVMGGSIGKLLMGIMVVNPENNKISFWRAVLRNYIGYFVSCAFVWLGFIWAWKDKEHRSWHDMIANTYVITNNNYGIVTGLLAVIALALSSVYLILLIVGQLNYHMPLYQEIYTDIKTEFSPTPTPLPVVSGMDKFNQIEK